MTRGCVARSVRLGVCLSALGLFVLWPTLGQASPALVLTQMTEAAWRGGYEGARIVVVGADRKPRLLTAGFHSAADPDVSFDGRRMVFAAKRLPGDAWQIFEMPLEGGAARQLTHMAAGCRNPLYLSRIFNLDTELPWYEIGFVSGGALHSMKLDGSGVKRLTYAPGVAGRPAQLPEGRIVYSLRDPVARGVLGMFGINLDGTDYARFLSPQVRSPRMAAASARREVLFVEGGGTLAAVSLDRPLHTRRVVTRPAEGEFATPSPVEAGGFLVSRRAGKGTFGIWKLDPATGAKTLLYDDPLLHDLQPREAGPRREPDGRGSVVDESDPYAVFYCLNTYTTDRPDLVAAGSAGKVRVLGEAGPLGDAPVESDGSFHIEVPANTAVRFQILSRAGVVLRTSGWVWARNREKRGCIGCHEDPELTPENREAAAILKRAVRLEPKPESQVSQ